MTLFLIYGNDATGKTVQLKNLCEMAEKALYVSLELKDRRLFKDIPFDTTEAIVPAKDYKIDGIASFEKLGSIIEKIINTSDHDTIVIDGISDLPRWAEKVVIRELQKKDPARRVIGEKDKQSWSVRNNLAHLPLERLSSWAEIKGRKVFLTSLMTDEYVGEKKVGRTVDAKDRLRKLCDVRVQLTRDGRGYLAHFEKVPGWAEELPTPVAIGKNGLAVEFAKRGLL